MRDFFDAEFYAELCRSAFQHLFIQGNYLYHTLEVFYKKNHLNILRLASIDYKSHLESKR